MNLKSVGANKGENEADHLREADTHANLILAKLDIQRELQTGTRGAPKATADYASEERKGLQELVREKVSDVYKMLSAAPVIGLNTVYAGLNADGSIFLVAGKWNIPKDGTLLFTGKPKEEPTVCYDIECATDPNVATPFFSAIKARDQALNKAEKSAIAATEILGKINPLMADPTKPIDLSALSTEKQKEVARLSEKRALGALPAVMVNYWNGEAMPMQIYASVSDEGKYCVVDPLTERRGRGKNMQDALMDLAKSGAYPECAIYYKDIRANGFTGKSDSNVYVVNATASDWAKFANKTDMVMGGVGYSALAMSFTGIGEIPGAVAGVTSTGWFGYRAVENFVNNVQNKKILFDPKNPEDWREAGMLLASVFTKGKAGTVARITGMGMMAGADIAIGVEAYGQMKVETSNMPPEEARNAWRNFWLANGGQLAASLALNSFFMGKEAIMARVPTKIEKEASMPVRFNETRNEPNLAETIGKEKTAPHEKTGAMKKGQKPLTTEEITALISNNKWEELITRLNLDDKNVDAFKPEHIMPLLEAARKSSGLDYGERLSVEGLLERLLAKNEYLFIGYTMSGDIFKGGSLNFRINYEEQLKEYASEKNGEFYAHLLARLARVKEPGDYQDHVNGILLEVLSQNRGACWPIAEVVFNKEEAFTPQLKEKINEIFENRASSPTSMLFALFPEKDMRLDILKSWVSNMGRGIQEDIEGMEDLESKRPGAVHALYSTFKITHFERYDLETLVTQYDKMKEVKEGKKDGRPVVAVIFPRADENGAFGTRRYLFESLQRDCNVFICEAGGKPDIVRRLATIKEMYGITLAKDPRTKKYAPGPLIAAFAGGHGLGPSKSTPQIRFGHGERGVLTIDQFLDAGDITRYFVNDKFAGGIISCSAGATGGFAQGASAKYKKAIFEGPENPSLLPSNIIFKGIRKDGRPQFKILWPNEEDKKIYVGGEIRFSY